MVPDRPTFAAVEFTITALLVCGDTTHAAHVAIVRFGRGAIPREEFG